LNRKNAPYREKTGRTTEERKSWGGTKRYLERTRGMVDQKTGDWVPPEGPKERAGGGLKTRGEMTPMFGYKITLGGGRWDRLRQEN